MKLNFSTELYQSLKIEANKQDKPIASLITEILYQYTNSRSKENIKCQDQSRKK